MLPSRPLTKRKIMSVTGLILALAAPGGMLVLSLYWLYRLFKSRTDK